MPPSCGGPGQGSLAHSPEASTGLPPQSDAAGLRPGSLLAPAPWVHLIRGVGPRERRENWALPVSHSPAHTALSSPPGPHPLPPSWPLFHAVWGFPGRAPGSGQAGEGEEGRLCPLSWAGEAEGPSHPSDFWEVTLLHTSGFSLTQDSKHSQRPQESHDLLPP